MLLILVVLYNKNLNNSDTLKGIIESASILNEQNCKVVINDNSIKQIEDTELQYLKAKLSHFEYFHYPENKPLSFLYNNTLDKYEANSNYKYLVLFDDDSKINISFFTEVISAINKNGYPNLLLPVVYNNGHIKSPEKDFIFKTSMYKTPPFGFLKAKNITAINSGMVISLNYTSKNNFRYDLSFDNYGTDGYFMKEYRKNNHELFVMNYILNHSLSFYDSNDNEKRLSVFKSSKRVRKQLYAETFTQKIFVLIANSLSAMKQCVKYKSLEYLND